MSVSSHFLVFSCLFFLLVSPLAAQKSKEDLQREKKRNLERIKAVEKILTETRGKKKNTIGELNALNQRIKAQEGLIKSIRTGLNLLNEEIDETNLIIESLEDDLSDLKQEYAAMVYATHKANQGFNKLTFIFSSSSFHEFFMRLKYMEQYTDARETQVEQIQKVQESLKGQVTVIASKRSEKSILLTEELSEGKNLGTLKQKQNRLVKNLEKEEQKFRKELGNIRKSVAKLDRLIKEIIESELTSAKATTSNVALSASFAENRSKFPWPVDGFVSLGFGTQKHPVLRNIMLKNDGINIQTTANQKVKAIFNGEVSRVAFVPLLGNTVIIKHGEYLTVYTGLKDVFVKRGQKVALGEELGTVLTNSDGVSELKFQLRKRTQALDPEQWLVRK